MSGRPPSPSSPVTSSIGFRRPSRGLIGRFILLLLSVLCVATNGFAAEPAAVESTAVESAAVESARNIPAAEVDSAEAATAANEALNRKLEASLREIATRLAARTRSKADLIVRDETRRLTQQLVRLNDQSSTVEDEISREVDARLDSAIYRFRGEGYEVATNRRNSEL